MYTKAGSRSSRCVYRINFLSSVSSTSFESTPFYDRYLRLGAVVHKLMGHKNAIVSVSFTTDCNMAITGKGQLLLHCSVSIASLLRQASQDGLLSAWSTLTGVHLATFHFNQNLVKLLVAPTGGRILRGSLSQSVDSLFTGRYAAILQNVSCVAMLSLFNIPSGDALRANQRQQPGTSRSIERAPVSSLLLDSLL